MRCAPLVSPALACALAMAPSTLAWPALVPMRRARDRASETRRCRCGPRRPPTRLRPSGPQSRSRATAEATLLTLTPENAGHVREAAARLSDASARGAIGAWVAGEARRMAGRDLATASYPERIEADTDRLTAEVAGELETWIGREEAAREDRRYRLAFRIDGGRIGLVRFEQLED